MCRRQALFHAIGPFSKMPQTVRLFSAHSFLYNKFNWMASRNNGLNGAVHMTSWLKSSSCIINTILV